MMKTNEAGGRAPYRNNTVIRESNYDRNSVGIKRKMRSECGRGHLFERRATGTDGKPAGKLDHYLITNAVRGACETVLSGANSSSDLREVTTCKKARGFVRKHWLFISGGQGIRTLNRFPGA